MSEWKNSPSLDPAIFGPLPPREDRILGAAPAPRKIGSGLDLSSSSPLTDYFHLLLRPQIFFRSLFQEAHDFSPWIWGKSLLFGALALWASSLKAQADAYQQFSQIMTNKVDPEWFFYLQEKIGVEKLQEKLKVLVFLALQFQTMISPLLQVGEVLMGSALLAVGLRWVGVDWKQISLPRIILFFVYLQIFHFFSLVPIVGSLLSFVLHVLYGVFAIKVVYQLSTWDALKAHFLVSYLVANLIGTMALVPLLIGIQLFF